MDLERSNEIKARLLGHYEKTIALLTDDRPDFNRDEAVRIGRFLQNEGYYVYEIGVKEFCSKNLALISSMTIIPHAESVPVEFAQAMKKYYLQGGQIIVLGGPMFCELVEEENGRYVRKELPAHVLDAQHTGKAGDITIEGLIPTHKVYLENAAVRFETEDGQRVTKAQISSGYPERVVCPVARPYGSGFGMEHRNRFIPLVSVIGEGGRDKGKRGAAAFIMLSDTRGHLRFTNGSRPGSVSATVMGSAIACIGLRRQNLMDVEGFPKLLLDIVGKMYSGLYLFEGGATKFIYDAGERLQLGARILNTTQDFRNVRVVFDISGPGEERKTVARDILAMPRTFTECRAEGTAGGSGEYTVRTVLLSAEGKELDSAVQELAVPAYSEPSPEDFVRVNGRDFILHGRQWNMLGISYWPLYYPSFDREDYWMGWLDRSNYDPSEVEKDMCLFDDMGINCLFTRLDGNIFDRSIEQLRDFMYRLGKHGIKLSLSYANATNPLNYCHDAFVRLMDDARLHNNPVLFGHDISWEIGHQYFMENYLPQWTDGWVRWINERYGSVENAEKVWKVPADRMEDGALTHPPKEQLEFDGPWRIKICAFRRYMDDMLSRAWNDAVTDMRSIDPVHIIGYRMGCFYKDGGASLTSTNKHIDYSSLEGYSFMENEDGRFASQCVTKVSQLLTGGKPVVWVEYGNNLIGTSGNSAWSALKWNRTDLCPVPEKIEEQVNYYNQFFRMFKACDIAGSVPWWYAGGFRRVECSDCGIVAPDGTLRPVAEDYVALGRDWLLKERTHSTPDRTVSYDPDVHSAGWGKFYLGSGPIDRNENSWAAAEGKTVPGVPEYGPGVMECRKAEEDGVELAFTTPGFGTDSAAFPVVCVGNTEYDGANPPKYLDSEFNSITLNINGTSSISVRNGDTVSVPYGAEVTADASVGNLREARWLSGDETSDGTVCLSIESDGKHLRSISFDTEYLHDARITDCPVCGPVCSDIIARFRMESVSRAVFGECWSITLHPEI